MPSIITATIIGQEKVLAALTAFQTTVRDLRGFWTDVFAPRYFGEVQDRFNLQGQGRSAGGQFASGGRWAPLSARYAAWKARHYPGKKILELKGDLKGSLQWTGKSLGPGGIFISMPTYALAGTGISYARAHQLGGRNLPARPFMASPDAATYGPLLRNWILREVGKTGAKVKL